MRRGLTAREADFLSLIELLYACATEPAEWPRFLERFGHVSGSEVVVLLLQDVSIGHGSWLWQWGLSPDAQDDYLVWAPQNPWMRVAEPLMHTGAVVRNAPISRQELFASDFYNEFMRHHARVGDCSGACLYRERDTIAALSAARAASKRDYGAGHERLLRVVLPHLQRVVSIQRKLGLMQLERQATAEALDRLAAGILLLDEAGRVMLHNNAARRFVDQADGLLLKAGRLAALRFADDAALQKLVAESCAAGAGRGTAPGGAIGIQRPSGCRPYGVIVSPLAMRQWPFLPQRPAALVFVSDPEVALASADVLRQLFALTPAEARLASALAACQSLEDYAESAEITIGTARWTLKRVLEKTGCRRQSELVQLVATSVAGLTRS
jgi:DNA-binding CsgD family transcriptional regulator/PAS domain-containing protein